MKYEYIHIHIYLYSYFTRNIHNHCIDSFKILGVTWETCPAIDMIWRPGYKDYYSSIKFRKSRNQMFVVKASIKSFV